MKRLVLTALAFFLLAQALDLWFSYKTPEFAETNPFARDAQCGFLPKRGIAVKAITGGAIIASGALVWFALGALSPELGAFAFAGLVFYWGIDTLFNAVVPNFLLWLGWYQSCGAGGPS